MSQAEGERDRRRRHRGLWRIPFARKLRRRWRRLNRYERRRRVRLAVFFGALAFVLVVVVLTVWALQTVSSAESDLNLARGDVEAVASTPKELLSATGRQTAAADLGAAADLADQAARTLQSSPGLAAAGWLPWVSSQRRGGIDLARDLATTARSGRALLGPVNRLVADSHGTTVDLDDLRALGTALHQVVATQRSLLRSPAGLAGGIASARRHFNTDDRRVVGLLSKGEQLVDYALPFLGADGPRTYLLAAENNAEMRDQGAVLSLALMTAAGGTYHVSDADPISDFQLTHPADVPIPPGTAKVFGAYAPTFEWQSVNATADFPWSGLDMQAMFLQATGRKVDGVIGIDVPMVARLLALTGPVRVAGIPVPVRAGNLSTVLLHDLYQGLPPLTNQQERTDKLSAVARAVVDKLAHSHVDLAALANALAHGVAARDLLAWDDVPAYQATIRKFGGSGAVDTDQPDRTFHIAVENATATKLDYYVHVAVSMDVEVTSLNDAVVNTTVTVTNTAPPHQKPSYQLGPDRISSFVTGQYVGHVYLWGPRGSLQLDSTPESGLNLLEQDLSVLPGASAKVHFQTVIQNAVRNGQLQLVFFPQPRLSPESLSVRLDAPSWLLVGNAEVTTVINRTQTLTWSLLQ